MPDVEVGRKERMAAGELGWGPPLEKDTPYRSILASIPQQVADRRPD